QEVVLALDPLAVVDERRGRCGGGFRRGRAVVAGRGGRAAGSRRRSSSGCCGGAAGCRCRRGGGRGSAAAGGGRRGRLGGVAVVVMAAGGQREQGGTQEWQTLEHGNLVIGGTWDRRRRPGVGAGSIRAWRRPAGHRCRAGLRCSWTARRCRRRPAFWRSSA